MHLLAALNSGHPAAANGTAEICIRGSSTRATWYASLEGDGADSSGSDITLDAYGSALVYVNQLVDVVVKDADGNPVRSYGDGTASGNVEVRSLAFTGTHYDTAASAAGNPTTLQAILDLWLTNSGAIDWKVLIAGSATTLQNAFGALTGLVYNVKSPSYGAVGDGTTSDQAAIQAAHDAAVAAGGGIVFVPNGTYRMTAAIVWDKSVALVGIGMDQSILTMDAAAEKILRFTAANTSDTPTLIYGIGFQTAQANSTTTIELTTAGAFVEFSHCGFAKTATATGLSITLSHADVRLRCIECHFNWRSSTIGVYSSSVQADSVLFQGCRFTPQTSATFDGIVLTTRGTTAIRDCLFDYGTSSPTGTSIVIDVVNGVDTLTVTGCSFQGGPGTITCFDLIEAALVVARDNVFDGVTNRYALASGVLQNGSFIDTEGYQREESTTTTLTMTTGVSLLIFQSTGTVPTVTLPTKLFIGQKITVIIMNDSGLAWATNVVITGDQPWGTVDTSADDGQVAFFEFVVADVDSVGSPAWVPTSMKLGSA